MHKDNGLMQKETDSLGPVVMDEQGRVHLPPSVMDSIPKKKVDTSKTKNLFDDYEPL